MTFAMLFWILMLFWLLFGFIWNNNPGWTWGWMPNTLLLFALFALLGWHVFGPAIHG